MPFTLVLAAIATIVFWGTSVTTAQVDLPVPFPPVPAPTECVVQPVDEEIIRSSAVGLPATPLATPAELTSALSLFPDSESAESPARQEIEDLERQFAACFNAGDSRRIVALFTRSYLNRIVAAAGDRVSEFYPVEPEPLDRLDWIPVAVMDVRRVDEELIVALVNFCDFLQVHYFRQENQQWRIDDSVDVYVNEGEFCSAQGPIPPTP